MCADYYYFMTKLKIIKQELEANRNVYIAPIDVYPPARCPTGETTLHEGYCVDLCVAPIEGLYLPNQLNEFMEGLTSVKPN